MGQDNCFIRQTRGKYWAHQVGRFGKPARGSHHLVRMASGEPDRIGFTSLHRASTHPGVCPAGNCWYVHEWMVGGRGFYSFMAAQRRDRKSKRCAQSDAPRAFERRGCRHRCGRTVWSCGQSPSGGVLARQDDRTTAHVGRHCRQTIVSGSALGPSSHSLAKSKTCHCAGQRTASAASRSQPQERSAQTPGNRIRPSARSCPAIASTRST